MSNRHSGMESCTGNPSSPVLLLTSPTVPLNFHIPSHMRYVVRFVVICSCFLYLFLVKSGTLLCESDLFYNLSTVHCFYECLLSVIYPTFSLLILLFFLSLLLVGILDIHHFPCCIVDPTSLNWIFMHSVSVKLLFQINFASLNLFLFWKFYRNLCLLLRLLNLH